MNTTQPQPVPYQAYKSKRHSRNLSATPAPVVSPPSCPSSVGSNGNTFSPSTTSSKDTPLNGVNTNRRRRPASTIEFPSSSDSPPSTASSEDQSPSTNGMQNTTKKPKPLSPKIFPTSLPNGFHRKDADSSEQLAQPEPSSSKGPGPGSPPKPPESMQKSPPHNRKTSTFRRMPLRETRPALPSSPLRTSQTQTPSAASLALLSASSPLQSTSPLRPGSPLRNGVVMEPSTSPQALSPLILGNVGLVSDVPVSYMLPPPVRPTRSPSPPAPLPPPKSIPTPSVDIPPPGSSRSISGSTTTSAPTPVSTIPRTVASVSGPVTRFYRPGFQPKGIYRPRTEEFAEARRSKRSTGKIEQTRLERRLEKLINLHFSEPPEKPTTPQPLPVRQRRTSLFKLDFSELRGKSTGELWKDVVKSQAQSGKNDIRVAEQKITPWEEDSTVSRCPLCLTSFHPITNRKHHCRLCGRIICSLPVRHPHRPATCSILFIANTKTGVIEEVGEGIDYGVRKRTTSTVGPGRGLPSPGDDQKFLSGVRICRDCRPVLLRQQYIHEARSTPMFTKLYNLLINIEKEIEDSLPQFQELLHSLNNDERPTAEASAARKRLVEAFAHYDTAAKRIQALPCPRGSSQDRVQMAILTRANLFLQKNMFPLQSLPKPARKTNSGSSTPSTPTLALNETTIDPDSELAHALQPLLEQEALVETFVQEATAKRKFEDAQILRENLKEIRGEIDRIVANAERDHGRGKGKART